ncbi:TetR/AcrR family transcriptional regulator [Secundilactobacillus collinoides]|uniref:Transcriptional regulator n=2 Tax=Secundilactobacillus collinoides TaxID=33960 RepID=A0A0R2BJL7_SECCO|nr:TetR/AcrR family transcriptional regulator [Secundilactobacillus collinoides]KRM77956.1 transcriptional regulator [Secundilactobacillus collinoides DSM 20515 = JCM 1123]KZL38851.1 hypothetical protein TY91_11580 [Secundilactobacillus collinoides]
MTKRRRHGEELENAIFESTIAILDSDGLEGLTFSKVASLAKTSRPVIYRRWDSPFSLALDAIRNKIRKENSGHLQDIKLNGDHLKDDLSQVLRRYMVVINTFSHYYASLFLAGASQENDTVLDSLFDYADKEDIKTMTLIFERAIARKEITKDNFSDEVKLLPFEWLRYHLFTEKNVSEAQLQHFIEIVLLPVYTQK